MFDLVEFRFDHILKVFVKVQTLKYNLPKAILYAEKKKVQFLTPRSRSTKFKIVPNGTYQYASKF